MKIHPVDRALTQSGSDKRDSVDTSGCLAELVSREKARVPTKATLFVIHRCHIQAIKFDNTAIFNDEPMSCSIDAVFERLEIQEKGDICVMLSLKEHIGRLRVPLSGSLSVP